ncbi:DNA-directed RNA polymerase III subunit RPC10 [Neocloeon triangulifer]|uniref:DNA-directed RNA polymerase III subunit RPC10 n=1 Tax=Neocloeon triangulifer TaxID=2078957 RepID=UPI00286EF129|nr:DNA-directed RNA polymerase III subunit RPC10 [Neocloeon triangulifer]
MPIHFCPWCGNMLSLTSTEDASGTLAFVCNCCPYSFLMENECVCRYIYTRRKELDDVLGGADAWKNVDSTEAQCPSCNHHRAYFMQLQTRSADEPMTVFYKCCKDGCGYRWKE